MPQPHSAHFRFASYSWSDLRRQIWNWAERASPPRRWVGGSVRGSLRGMVWTWFPPTLEWIERLKIEPREVLQALGARRRWPRQAVDNVTGLRALSIWARTDAGRSLMVALRPLGGRDWEIVGVRELTAGELLELEEWEAGRDE